MEEFEGTDDLKNLFKEILGSDVDIKDNLVITDESVFCVLINKLDKSHKDDEALFELSGIDLSKTNSELWMVVETLLKLQYGESSFDLIMWWLLDRFNPDGKVVPFEGEDGKTYSIITAKDLYQFMKHRSPHNGKI
jgi:hypothetical protein|tara:strand:+ start:237 stop:644 length:408 start_codon:yes stop_codon:yes gene_type:complete